MVSTHRRIVHLVFKRVADVAIGSVERSAGPGNVVAAAIILPRDVLCAQEIADAGHGDRGNRSSRAWRALRRPGRVDVHRIIIVAGIAFRGHAIWQLAKVVEDWLDPRL